MRLVLVVMLAIARPSAALQAYSSFITRAASRARSGHRLTAAPPAREAASGSEQASAGVANVKAWLTERMRAAIVAQYGEELRDIDPLVAPATKAAFGDYQCNAAMSLAKRVGKKPRDVAVELVEAAELSELCVEPEIAGPGFLNIRVRPDALARRLAEMLADEERLALPRKPAKRVVVDYSSPNIAKEMHVGHLRSTVIGDALARLLELQGHSVLRLNHVGDWGTQFGMLITYLREVAPEAIAAASEDRALDLDLGDLVSFYKAAKRRFDEDEGFQTESRGAVVALQAGDRDSLAAWRALCAKSRVEFEKIYRTLGVDERLEERGESFYNSGLDDVVRALEEAGVLVESDGARVVFPEGHDPAAAATAEGKEKPPPPLIVVKSDGGYMYSTTDLAAIVHRATVEGAERVLYVTDSGQALHFAQVFDAARRAGLVGPAVELTHVPFGLVLGEDGKKFKTRSGETVRLADLLDEAVRIAREDVAARQAEGDGALDVDALAQTIGIAAVKYADLSMNRNSNYKFSYKKMLSLSGNTAPYMLYAYARISGIRRKAGGEELLRGGSAGAAPKIMLDTPEESALAMHLVRLPEVLDQVRLCAVRALAADGRARRARMKTRPAPDARAARSPVPSRPPWRQVEEDLLPHRLCEYVFELSGKFNQFYEACPVLKAPSDELRLSRAALCTVTANTLRVVLSVLGLPTVEAL